MCVPAGAFAINGAPTSGNYYGCTPNNAVGTDTVPNQSKDSYYTLPFVAANGSRTIVAACGGSGTAIQDWSDIIGLDGIGTSSYNWGTRINVSPNHFAWNDILYSSEDEETCKQQNGDATSPTTGIGFVKSGPTGTVTYATVDKYRPDVLAGGSGDITNYQKIVEAIQTADGNKNYSPQYATLNTNTLITLVDSMWAEAEAAKAVLAADSKATTRYEDPYEIAENVENFVLGLQWYILSQHEQQDTLKTVAYVTSYADGTITVAEVDPTSSTTSPGRTYEGFEQITKYITNVNPSDWTKSTVAAGRGSTTIYTTTDINALKDCDVIFTADGVDISSALDAAGYKGKVCSNPKISVGNQGFGYSRNLVEYMSYLYPEDISLANSCYYWWAKFGHVKTQYIHAVMVDTESEKLLPTGNAESDLDVTNYSEDYMTARFVKGIAYYNEHKSDKNSYCSNLRLAATGTEGSVNHYQGSASYNIANATVKVTPAGKVTVSAEGVALVEGTDYTKGVSGKTVTITGKGGFSGTATASVPSKYSQSMKVTPASKTFKAKKVKKAKQTFKIKVSSAKGKVTYTVAKKVKKAGVSVSKAGKVTVKKGTKKGTYNITVKAAGNSDYKAATKTVKVKVK